MFVWLWKWTLRMFIITGSQPKTSLSYSLFLKLLMVNWTTLKPEACPHVLHCLVCYGTVTNWHTNLRTPLTLTLMKSNPHEMMLPSSFMGWNWWKVEQCITFTRKAVKRVLLRTRDVRFPYLCLCDHSTTWPEDCTCLVTQFCLILVPDSFRVMCSWERCAD